MTAKALVTLLSRAEEVLQPEILVSPSIDSGEATRMQVTAGFEAPTPGADYIWYDCSGDTLE